MGKQLLKNPVLLKTQDERKCFMIDQSSCFETKQGKKTRELHMKLTCLGEKGKKDVTVPKKG